LAGVCTIKGGTAERIAAFATRAGNESNILGAALRQQA
jgi:hypothetical protein